MDLKLPRLYAILDACTLDRLGIDLVGAADELRSAGVTLFQYRNKGGDRASVLEETRKLAKALRGSRSRLILNDWADLVEEAGCDGVHLGQGDLAADEARRVIGYGKILGLSTHTEEEVRVANRSSADYIAIGPVFQTGSKHHAEATVGIDGVRKARVLTGKPLVAIGGISEDRIAHVLHVGADAVAVIGALFVPGRSMRESARSLLDASGWVQDNR